MQTLREALLSLVVLIAAAATVLGGIFLALGETGGAISQFSSQTPTPPRATLTPTVADVPTFPPLIIPLADTATPRPFPSSSAEFVLPTPFATLAPSLPPVASATVIATLTPTVTAAVTASPTARSSPSSTTIASSTLRSTSTLTSTPCAIQSGWVSYTVQQGETMFRIAQRYGLNTTQLQQGNCLASQNLFSGQKIFVPVVPTHEATDTRSAPTATASPLAIARVELATVLRDSASENGAIAHIRVVAAGGFTPYVYSDQGQGVGQPYDVIQIKTQCGATISGTIRVASADGQAATQSYIFYNLPCP